MLMQDKRWKQMQEDVRKVTAMIENGQLELKECSNYDYVANMARHSLDWSVGRLHKILNRLQKRG